STRAAAAARGTSCLRRSGETLVQTTRNHSCSQSPGFRFIRVAKKSQFAPDSTCAATARRVGALASLRSRRRGSTAHPEKGELLSGQQPLPRAAAWRGVGTCFVSSVPMLALGELGWPRENVGRSLRFANGTS